MIPIDAETVDAAFRAILAHNFSAAARAIAQAQVMHYGLKPWEPGFPTHDACGNGIVYRDHPNLDRYSVDFVQADGSHIRTPVGYSHICPRFIAVGETEEVAMRLAAKYVTENRLRDAAQLRTGAPQEGGGFAVTFEHGRSLD